ncbi:MAG: (2Fe-2S)-binding protein [Planctomycetales bacterium]
MQPDDEVCLCFHVTKRKVLNFIRITQPKKAGQLAECWGAGTGCGWCRDTLTRYFDEAVEGGRTKRHEPDAAEYAAMRGKYIREGGGTPPPGAAPIPDSE